jgi:hypothetical protein
MIEPPIFCLYCQNLAAVLATLGINKITYHRSTHCIYSSLFYTFFRDWHLLIKPAQTNFYDR